MTDKERLLALLQDFGIEPQDDTRHFGRNAVVLEAHKGGVIGYDAFICRFSFTPEGKFEEVGVWE
jgi:hypothetical protein